MPALVQTSQNLSAQVLFERAPRPAPRRLGRLGRHVVGALLAGSLALTPACANLDFTRDTQSSGTFRSSGWSFTILTWDFPELAMQIARENASDANLPNMVVTNVYEAPALGWFDWILNIIGVRYARIRGTWGFSGE